MKDSDQLRAQLVQYDNLRAVLWGHVHQEFDADRNGVRLLSTPSTCVQFAPGADEFALHAAAPGYRWLTLNADGSIDTDVMRLPDAPVPVPDPGEAVVDG